MAKAYALILAGGKGERLSWHVPKQFMKIAGKTLLEHTVAAFERSGSIDEIIIVTNPRYRIVTEELMVRGGFRKVRKILDGGDTRRGSSTVGVKSIPEEDAFVLVHDAVMPFVSEKIIRDCLRRLRDYDAVDVAIPTVDTIIQVNEDMTIRDIPDRRYIMRGLTPQAFRVKVLRKAQAMAEKAGDTVATDDCALVLRYAGGTVYVVPGDKFSIKVTYPEDVYVAEKMFQIRGTRVPARISLKGLAGKVLVVFGGSRGIGKEILSLARSHGARVHGISRHGKVDIRSSTQIRKALARIRDKEGAIDMVAVTAAVLRAGKLENIRQAEIDEMVGINYVGSINAVRASLPHLRESGGSIVLYAGTSYTRGRALYAVYTSTKAAIVNLVQGLAEEFLGDGVRINAMNPERVAGPMREENFGIEPKETLLDPREVAAASLKTLLSDLTGQVVDVKKKG